MSQLTTAVDLFEGDGYRTTINVPAQIADVEFVVWNRCVYRLQPRALTAGPQTPRFRRVFAWWATTEGG